MKYLGLTGLERFYRRYIMPLGTASRMGVANNLLQETYGEKVLDAYQGKLLKDGLDAAEDNIEALEEKDGRLEDQINGILSSVPTRIYDANDNIIDATKIGNIVIARFAIVMNDTTERTLTLRKGYGPPSGFFLPLIRNGKLASNAWLTNNGSNGTLTYCASESNYGTYTCSAVYYASI